MITKLRLKELIDYKAKPDRPILSVYLDIDQSNAANLNCMFEVSLFNVLREVEETLDNHDLGDFKKDAIRIRQFIEGYRPQAKGLVIFCDSSEDFIWAYELHVPVKTEARWSSKPYLMQNSSAGTAALASMRLTICLRAQRGAWWRCEGS